MMTTSAFALLASPLALASTSGSFDAQLYSGVFAGAGEHPAPVVLGKVLRGDRFTLSLLNASALVNYSDPEHSLVIERVEKIETGATVSCPWFMKIEGQGLGTRMNSSHTTTISHPVFCDDGACTNEAGQPLAKVDLLFGQYHLPKVKTTDGRDLGFADTRNDLEPIATCTAGKVCGPSVHSYPIYCPEFTVERSYSDAHFFDLMLITPTSWEEPLLDLDIDLRKIYLSFENERHDRTHCVLADLMPTADSVQIADRKDCELPVGDSFTVSVQSRFFYKITKPCGKFVARGVSRADDNGTTTLTPDWFMGWYECDGKIDRSPIEKQYLYPTRFELRLDAFLQETP